MDGLGENVDLAAMNTAIDRVMAYRQPMRAEQNKKRAHSKAWHPLPVKEAVDTCKSSLR